MATEKLEINFKKRTNPQIQKHKTSHELTLIRPQMQHRSPEHVHLKFLIPITSVKKNVNLLHGLK